MARYRAECIAYRTLHDGQALLVNGPQTRSSRSLLKKPAGLGVFAGFVFDDLG